MQAQSQLPPLPGETRERYELRCEAVRKDKPWWDPCDWKVDERPEQRRQRMQVRDSMSKKRHPQRWQNGVFIGASTSQADGAQPSQSDREVKAPSRASGKRAGRPTKLRKPHEFSAPQSALSPDFTKSGRLVGGLGGPPSGAPPNQPPTPAAGGECEVNNAEDDETSESSGPDADRSVRRFNESDLDYYKRFSVEAARPSGDPGTSQAGRPSLRVLDGGNAPPRPQQRDQRRDEDEDDMGVVTEMVQSLIAEVSSTRKLVEAQQSQIHELRLQQTGMLNALQKATRTADVIEKFQTQFPQEMRDAITDASSGYSKLGGAMTEVSTTLARLCRLNSIDASQLYDYWETIPGTFEGIERFHADFKEAQLELQELAIPRVDEQGKRIVPDPELRVAAQARLKAATKALEEALILKEEAERRMQEAAQPTIEEVAAAVWLWNCHLYPDRTLTTSLDEQASLVLVDAARTAATYGAKSVAESLDEGRIMAALMTSMSWYFNDETFSQEQRTPSGLLASLLKYKIPIAGYLNGPKPKLWTRASVLEMVNKRLTKEHVPG